MVIRNPKKKERIERYIETDSISIIGSEMATVQDPRTKEDRVSGKENQVVCRA